MIWAKCVNPSCDNLPGCEGDALQAVLIMYGIRKILLLLFFGLSFCGGFAHAVDMGTSTPGEKAVYSDETHEGAVTITETRGLPLGTRAEDPAPAVQKKRDMTGFWVIGVLINIVVMTAFAVWAVGQWRKRGR